MSVKQLYGKKFAGKNKSCTVVLQENKVTIKH